MTLNLHTRNCDYLSAADLGGHPPIRSFTPGAPPRVDNRIGDDGPMTHHRLAVAGTVPRRPATTFSCRQRAAAGTGPTRSGPGYRLSGAVTLNPLSDARPVATFSSSAERPERPGIIPLHVFEPLADTGGRASKVLRGTFGPAYVVTGAIRSEAGVGAFGTPLIANPDLQRYRTGAVLDAPDRTTCYAGDDNGFTDGPTLMDAQTQGVAMGTACQEMTLRSALSDPLIRTVMAADKVDPGELESMLRGIAEQIASHGPPHTAVDEPRTVDTSPRRLLS